jgi:IrrE N-terminal-like domain
MRIRKRSKFQVFLRTAITVLVLGTFGCGGGGGDDQVAFNPGQTVGDGGGVSTPVLVPQTFNYPTFNTNSKLTVIANFQTQEETPNITGMLSTTLGNLAGLAPKLAFRSDLSDPSVSSGPNRCGYPDACALHALMGPSVRSQAAPPTNIRPRFEELLEGAQESFFLIPAFKSVTAEKILEPNETTRCTIFAEVVNNTPAIDRTRALAIAAAFDSNNPQRPGSGIYDQVRAVFGSEWNQNPPGGNDGDQKVVLFFFSAQTLGTSLFGYTSPADGDPDGGAVSNKGEIIYINAGKPLYQQLATISHEFQHLVNQNEKVNQQGLNPPGASDENISVNEGLSGLAEEVCGYTYESGNDLLVDVSNNYLEKPERHEFFDFFQAGLGYGQGYLFFRYVREHFGDSTILAICTDTRTGLVNLNAHLPGGFPEIFRRWTVANYATNLSGSVPDIYRYPSGLRTDGTFVGGTLVGVKTTPLINNQVNSTGALHPWSASYQTLESNPGVGVTATILPAEGSPFGIIFESTADQFTSFDD